MTKKKTASTRTAPDASAGGRAVVEKLGVEHMSAISGGKVTFKKHGREHYVRMAKLAAARRTAINDAGKKALGL
jgi:hypothetical protein